MSKGFLVCDNCGGFYELQENDSVRDFNLECQCGGKLRYKAKLRHSEVIPSGIDGLILTLKSGKRNEKIKAARQLADVGDERAIKPLYEVWTTYDIYAAKYAIEKIKEREKIDLDVNKGKYREHNYCDDDLKTNHGKCRFFDWKLILVTLILYSFLDHFVFVPMSDYFIMVTGSTFIGGVISFVVLVLISVITTGFIFGKSYRKGVINAIWIGLFITMLWLFVEGIYEGFKAIISPNPIQTIEVILIFTIIFVIPAVLGILIGILIQRKLFKNLHESLLNNLFIVRLKDNWKDRNRKIGLGFLAIIIIGALIFPYSIFNNSYQSNDGLYSTDDLPPVNTTIDPLLIEAQTLVENNGSYLAHYRELKREYNDGWMWISSPSLNKNSVSILNSTNSEFTVQYEVIYIIAHTSDYNPKEDIYFRTTYRYTDKAVKKGSSWKITGSTHGQVNQETYYGYYG